MLVFKKIQKNKKNQNLKRKEKLRNQVWGPNHTSPINTTKPTHTRGGEEKIHKERGGNFGVEKRGTQKKI
jgi:hypothetical protein